MDNVYCYAETVPRAVSDDLFCTFDTKYIKHATLYVPESAINAYQTTEPWSIFGIFKTLEGTELDKCKTPTISYINGKLTFASETEDVKYLSEVKCADVGESHTADATLAACYDISVRASRTGYKDSDVVTAKLYWLTASGELETNINAAKMRGVVAQSSDGFITISGLNDNEKVDFYGIDGKTLGTATAFNGTTSFAAPQGTVVVAKIGKESVKIAVE